METIMELVTAGPCARWQGGRRSLLTMRCPGGDHGLAAGTTVGQQDRSTGGGVPGACAPAAPAASFIVAQAAMGRQPFSVTLR